MYNVPLRQTKASQNGDATPAERRQRQQLKKPANLNHDEDVMAPAERKKQQQQRTSVWSDSSLVRKRVSSPLLTPDGNRDDPFAGMNSSINYQQEIERLKALVPKVDPKKRPSGRPRSTGIDSSLASGVARQQTHNKSKSQSSFSSVLSGGNRRGTTSPPSRFRPASTESRATTPSSSPCYGDGTSRVTSPISTPRSLSPAQSDYTSTTIPPVPEEDELEAGDNNKKSMYGQQKHASVITEEEKARFLEFMRSWTGGWKDWEKSENHHHFNGMESVRSGGSLWAEQMPWVSPQVSGRRRCSWQDSQRPKQLSMTIPERNSRLDFSMRSEPCTPLLAPR